MAEQCIYCGDPALVRKHELEDDALLRIATDATDLLVQVRQYMRADGSIQYRASSTVTSAMRKLSNSLQAFHDIGSNHEMIRVTVARLLKMQDDLDSD